MILYNIKIKTKPELLKILIIINKTRQNYKNYNLKSNKTLKNN